MSKTNLFLPRRIKVGFQNRGDTYTGQLAYIIYFDEKNKLRKEASWDSWRDHKIEPREFDNEPMEGFVLNKKVGGTCWSWNYRQTYVRVYDPRGFEFEITVPNLLYILENTSSIKGKGLDGKFVYGWEGTDLVLIPVSSPDYEELVSLNNKRFDGKKIYAKDLKIGATYLTKEGDEVVYLCKAQSYGWGYKFDDHGFKTYDAMCRYADQQDFPLREKFDSWIRKGLYTTYSGCPIGEAYFFSYLDDAKKIFTYTSVPGRLISVLSDDCVQDYAARYDALEHDPLFSPEDPSEDKMVDSTFEEFCLRVSDGLSFAISIDGAYAVLRCRNEGEQIAIWVYDSYDKPSKARSLLTSLFGKLGEREYCWKFTDDQIREVYDKLNVVHVDRYLKNGNIYRRDY